MIETAKYNKTLVFWAACAGLAFFGVAMLSLGPILGPLNANVEGATALPSTLSIGIIIGTLVFGPVVDRFGYKWLLVLGALCTLAGLQGLSNFSTLGVLHISMLSLGIGGGILNGETNALVAEIYDDEHRGMRLSVLGAFYCVGALGWTLMNHFIPEYKIPLDTMSVVMAGFIVYFCFIKFPAAKPQGASSLGKTLSLLKYPVLVLFAVILFFQSGFEGISGSFTVKYLEDTGVMDVGAATLSLTAFTVGMLIGRLLLGYVMKALSNMATLYVYLFVALVGVGMFYYGSEATMIYTAMALIGFGVGATYPVAFNYLGGVFRDMSGTAFSISIFIALCGQFAFNKVIGIFFEKGDYIYFPVALCGAIIIMMILLPVAVGSAKNKDK
ncbi:MAG: MFS transporter [Flavobacteriales bacterium]|nr:MFS transporter [Flavobacteriales bacterium]